MILKQSGICNYSVDWFSIFCLTMDTLVYEKLTAYCAYQERSVKDAQQKLIKLKVQKEEFSAYIERLKREGFLNEERFAKAFVAGHLRKKWGKAKIKSALMQKGISAAVIKLHLDNVEEEGYEEQLLKAAQQKLKSIKGETIYERRTKLLRFLLGKGYESSKAGKVVKELLSR